VTKWMILEIVNKGYILRLLTTFCHNNICLTFPCFLLDFIFLSLTFMHSMSNIFTWVALGLVFQSLNVIIDFLTIFWITMTNILGRECHINIYFCDSINNVHFLFMKQFGHKSLLCLVIIWKPSPPLSMQLTHVYNLVISCTLFY